MSGSLEKSLAILEFLVDYPDGASLAQIATELNQLRSGCHRTLQELIRFGYVRQLPQRGDYALTTRLAAMGLSFIGKSGVVDIAQPVLQRLARTTEELVRLAVERGRKTRPDIKLGVCGEHGGDPDSIHFFHQAGLDYVSCSPYRVPVARLAAAQAALADKKKGK